MRQIFTARSSSTCKLSTMHDIEKENYEAHLHGIQQVNLGKSAAQVRQQVLYQLLLHSNVSRWVGRLSSTSVLLQLDSLSTQ